MTIEKFLPGIAVVQNYKREWFSADLVAGLSVAAVALPVGIAYAQLGGFPPIVGIYSAILPLVAYALFGTSRQLMVNPDAASVAIVMSTIAPLAAGNPERYLDLSIALAFFTGIFLIIGGLGGLGVIANFLSRPILIGYLNGIALSIIIGQVGTLLGYEVPSGGFFRMLADAATHISETHVPTAVIGISTIVALRLMKRFLKRVPAPLIATIVGIAAVYFLGLHSEGVKVLGFVPAGFPAPHIPVIHKDHVLPLLAGAGGLMLVSFCSMMTTARGFAAKNGYTLDVNREMTALGVCDIASGLSSGFVVSGADSRTAVADSSGGKSQMMGIVAAIVMALILLFFTAPLAYVPTTVLAAILITSAMGLFDFASLRRFYPLSKPEFRQCVIAMLGVMTIGVLPGVVVAVALAILNLIRHASKPNDEVLGLIRGSEGIYAGAAADGAQMVPGLVIYRFNSGIVFFNADRFKEQVRNAIASTEPTPSWVLFDAGASPVLDVTGADAIGDLHRELSQQGIVFAVARASGIFRVMMDRSGVSDEIGHELMFSTVHGGAQAFLKSQNISEAVNAGPDRGGSPDE